MTDVVGSAEWTRALVAAHARPVRAYIARRITPSEVDDVVAEVFVVAWRRAADVPDGASALPYLLGIARRLLANSRRGLARRDRLRRRLEADVTTPDRPSAALDNTLRAMHQLRAADQEILRLAAWEELTTAEIAVVLGCSPATAAVRLSRARARLRDRLQGRPSIRTSRAARHT